MKLTLDDNHGSNLITGYRDGVVVINEREWSGSVVVTPDQPVQTWNVSAIHDLDAEQLAVVLEMEPEIVLIGTGTRQIFPDASVSVQFLQRGIGLEIMDSAAACRSYNILAAEDRRVVAAIYI